MSRESGHADVKSAHANVESAHADAASGHAIVRVAWAPGRAEPAHRAELTTQWPCGESLVVAEERDGWLRCRGEDGYEAWTPLGGLVRAGADEVDEWRSAADGVSLGTALIPTGSEPPAEERRLPVPARLPLGSRVRRHPAGVVELPSGARARALEPHGIVPVAELPARFRGSGDAVVTTARRWLGSPYVWGGRTEWGFDCSGLVQAIFRLHGVRLPRDSAPQAAAGPEVPGLPLPSQSTEKARTDEAPGGSPLPFPDLLEPLAAGDLLFFAPEGQGITHVAIHAGEGWVVHAAASNGCVAVDDLRAGGEMEARLRASVVAASRPLASSAA